MTPADAIRELRAFIQAGAPHLEPTRRGLGVLGPAANCPRHEPFEDERAQELRCRTCGETLATKHQLWRERALDRPYPHPDPAAFEREYYGTW